MVKSKKKRVSTAGSGGVSADIPKQISGYEYEVLACRRAIESGAPECPEMPHAETLRIMEQMDTIRAAFGIRYPFEED